MSKRIDLTGNRPNIKLLEKLTPETFNRIKRFFKLQEVSVLFQAIKDNIKSINNPSFRDGKYIEDMMSYSNEFKLYGMIVIFIKYNGIYKNLYNTNKKNITANDFKQYYNLLLKLRNEFVAHPKIKSDAQEITYHFDGNKIYLDSAHQSKSLYANKNNIYLESLEYCVTKVLQYIDEQQIEINGFIEKKLPLEDYNILTENAKPMIT